MIQIPETYELVYSQEEIEKRVEALAAKVNDWGELVGVQSSDQILAVCVLRGAVFFFSDLVRKIALPIEPVFCKAESYTANHQQVAGKDVRVHYGDIDAQGRHVLLVDDICDTGLTLFKLHNVFLKEGAKSVSSAVLIHREVDGSKYEPTWGAFNYDDTHWLVGYGLDDNGRNRNLPDVYRIQK